MMDFNYTFNLLLITLIIAVLMLVIYYCYKGDIEEGKDELVDEYQIDRLAREIMDTFHHILNVNIGDLGLNEEETKKRERQKHKLSKALRNCSYGDKGEKEFVKDYMKDLLQRYFKINEHTIDGVIFFSEVNELTIQDKFDILLHSYKKQYGDDAFEQLMVQHDIQIEKKYEDGIYYEIDRKDIEGIFVRKYSNLSYVDKLEIVAQRIYQISRGLGVVDELRDQGCLDGISGGVSGITNGDYNYMEEMVQSGSVVSHYKYDSVWVFWHGKSIHLSFLSFGSKRELERICKNIYRYDAPYYLSGIKGKVVAEDKRGNRITVARPPFSDDWKFFVRKFDSVKQLTMKDLLTDENSELVINTIKYIMAGSMVVVITGNQAVGKTTILKVLIQYIDPTLNIRMQEDVFETWLNKIYHRRNISSFRRTDSISMEEGMDYTKKTDGDVMILGEVAEQKVAALLIQLTQFTRQTLCTNHATTTPKLIEYFRNALLSTNIFRDERIAEEQVVNGIQWDIHMAKDQQGHRYIERITEIIPHQEEEFSENLTIKENMLLYFKKSTGKKPYEIRDIIRLQDGRYEVQGKMSLESLTRIRSNLSSVESEHFQRFYNENFT